VTDFVVSVDTSRLDAKLHRVPKSVEASVLRAVRRLAINLQGYVKDQKLSGQVLHVRSGTLRRSINQEVTQSGSVIKGIVGTNVSYARPHEYGFSGAVQVREHLRTITKVFGRPLANPVTQTVRAHTMNVNLPERSFLRSALKDFEPRILAELKAAASREVLK
jgi:phage gpG-like protein